MRTQVDETLSVGDVVLTGGELPALCVVVIAWHVRRYWRNYLFLLLGMAAIFRFVAVRIATFYGISLPELSRFTGGLRINWLLELIGISLIAVAAILNLRLRSRP